jgi:uncharacterized protein YdeI (BOF family)
MTYLNKITATTLAATLLCGSAYAAAPGTAKSPAPAATAVEAVEDGNVKFQNDAYINLSGTVAAIKDSDTFELKHTGGSIMVDTNDTWPDLFADNTATLLKAGDRVSVTGRVDNNMFSSNEIEAYQLTVNGSTFDRVYTNQDYAPGNDDDYMAYYNSYGAGLEDDQDVRLSGKISRVIDTESFTLRYGNGEIKVKTDEVDFSNTPNLKVGDSVVVFGEVDDGWFQKKELEADRIMLSRSYSNLPR